MSLLIDGKSEKTLFFASKPRWFVAHEVPSEPFEEFTFDTWSMSVRHSSNDENAIYSLVDADNVFFKEPYFINSYQGKTKQIKVKYFGDIIIWKGTHYEIKPSQLSKELNRADRLVRFKMSELTYGNGISMEAFKSRITVYVEVKIDKASMEILKWFSINDIPRTEILKWEFPKE